MQAQQQTACHSDPELAKEKNPRMCLARRGPKIRRKTGLSEYEAKDDLVPYPTLNPFLSKFSPQSYPGWVPARGNCDCPCLHLSPPRPVCRPLFWRECGRRFAGRSRPGRRVSQRGDICDAFTRALCPTPATIRLRTAQAIGHS